MPYADPQARAEYHRNYRILNADKVRESKRRHWEKNKEKCRLANKEYKGRNPDKVKECRRLWWHKNRDKLAATKYGLTLEQYQQLVQDTNGICPICGVDLVFDSRCHGRACLDHDHSNGQIRGIICNRCNMLLGKAQDSVTILANAIKYLERYKHEPT